MKKERGARSLPLLFWYCLSKQRIRGPRFTQGHPGTRSALAGVLVSLHRLPDRPIQKTIHASLVMLGCVGLVSETDRQAMREIMERWEAKLQEEEEAQ